MSLNYWFLLHQRRLRQRFLLTTLHRHEDRIQCALYAIRPSAPTETAMANADGGQP